MYRQGDLLIVPCELPKTGATEPTQDMKDGILERGETSGHAHKLRDIMSASLRRFAGVPDLYIDVAVGGGQIVHDEHAPIDLPPGGYKVVRQREFDPAAERQERIVQD